MGGGGTPVLRAELSLKLCNSVKPGHSKFEAADIPSTRTGMGKSESKNVSAPSALALTVNSAKTSNKSQKFR